MLNAGRDLERDADGKLTNPRALLRAVELEGIKLGPPGAGTLLALADRVPIAPPTFEEFARCVLMEGTQFIGPPQPQPRAPGRGFGIACFETGVSGTIVSLSRMQQTN